MLVFIALAQVDLKVISARVEAAPVREGHFHLDLVGSKRSTLQRVRFPAHADLQHFPIHVCVAAILRQRQIEWAFGLADDRLRVIELRDEADAGKFARDRNAGGRTGKARLVASDFDAEGITADAALGAGPNASVLRLPLDPCTDL